MTQCPDNPGQISYASPWYSPTSASTDYFNTCGFAGYVGVPANIWGYQPAKTGNGYAEIGVFGSSGFSIREYIQVPLTTTLIAGNLYCVKFFVSQAGVSTYTSSYTPIAITEIGLLFSNSAITTTNTLPLSNTPQIVSPAGVYLNDTTQWIEISGMYTALGGEKFITIGNFKDDLSTDTIGVGHPGFDPQSYYYVDDVSVIDCDSLVGINENIKSDGFKLYPNPNNGSMIIEYKIAENDKGVLGIYDLTGRMIKQYSLNSKNTSLTISGNELAIGTYYYSILINNRLIKTEKLIIIK